ncbi:MAG: NAD-dependent epimerase/dehydratase family protein, partial [Candidatus Thorarchaeota archaeon]
MNKLFKKKLIKIGLLLSISLLFLSMTISQSNNLFILSNQDQTERLKTDSVNYTIHNPITITSNAQFSSAGFSGTGTQNNPYKLSGFDFSNNITTASISITNTNAYFEINSNYFANNQNNELFLVNVSHAKIQSNIINASYNHGVKKLLFLGSSCIYPKYPSLNPKTDYFHHEKKSAIKIF